MARTIGRRPIFFAVLAGISLLLFYPTPGEFRWVPLFSASLAGVLALAVALDELMAPRGRSRADRLGRAAPRGQPESPFAPPPRPGGQGRGAPAGS